MQEAKIRKSFHKGTPVITVIGAPFSIHQSSCSNHQPETFEWTGHKTTHEVFIDTAIPTAWQFPFSNKEEGNKRFAWLCESNAIIPEVRGLFEDEQQFNKIINSYDAIFTCDRELVDRHEKIHFCFAGSNLPWIKKENYKIYDKSKVVSFIASSKIMCEGHQFRQDLHERFKKRDETATEISYKGKVYKKADESSIDVYGSILGKPFGYNPGCHLPFNAPEWHDKSEALNHYMFSVVLENAQYDDYFTEKLTDCFATGTVPVYLGSDNIGNYFNTDGMIIVPKDIEGINSIVNSLTPEMYYSRMDAIKDNFERVQKLQMADEMLIEKIKELE